MPVYLPLVGETHLKQDAGGQPEVFFGGINVYLQQALPVFRRTPRFVDRFFDSRTALSIAARMGEMTDPTKLGAMTLSMLQGEAGKQKKELNRMTEWLRSRPEPEFICLATSLQSGMVRTLKQAFPAARIAVFFQGEDEFLDALGEDYPQRCWQEMARGCAIADLLVAPTHYFRQRMAGRLGLPESSISVLPNGIDPGDFSEKPLLAPERPVIGYLARMCEEKGLDILVDAYIELAKKLPDPMPRLRIMGVMKRSDTSFVESQRQKLEGAGLGGSVEIFPNVSREEKISLLHSLTLFSVPTRCSEAFGLYLPEAMAAGVPCVQPAHSGFPEIIEDGESGWIYSPHKAEALAEAWSEALGKPEEIIRRAAVARKRASELFSIESFAERLIALVEKRPDFRR